MQVTDLQSQLAKSRAACSDMLSLGSLLDRERIQKARLQADLSAARIDRCAAHIRVCAAVSAAGSHCGRPECSKPFCCDR